MPGTNIKNITEKVMYWMYNNDEYALSTTKAHKLVSLSVAALYQKHGKDYGTIYANKLGPTINEAFDYINVPEGKTAEEHFSSAEDVPLDNFDEAETIQDTIIYYGQFSSQQLIAFTHSDEEWFTNTSKDAPIMNKALMLV